jgi:hypothetical protein
MSREEEEEEEVMELSESAAAEALARQAELQHLKDVSSDELRQLLCRVLAGERHRKSAELTLCFHLEACVAWAMQHPEAASAAAQPPQSDSGQHMSPVPDPRVWRGTWTLYHDEEDREWWMARCQRVSQAHMLCFTRSCRSCGGPTCGRTRRTHTSTPGAASGTG